MFLMWLFRTYKNLEPLGSENIRFTPGWSVGWWFIPFANLVMPFKAVRGVWSESDPATVGDEELPFRNSSVGTVLYVGVVGILDHCKYIYEYHG